MISRKILENVRTIEDAVRTWPGILDLNEIQRGGNPRYWAERFPHIENPRSYVAGMNNEYDWTPFWRFTAPFGALMFARRTADSGWRLLSGRRRSDEDPGESDPQPFVLEGLVKGILESEDPNFVLKGEQDGDDALTLYWIYTGPGGIDWPEYMPLKMP